METAYKRQQFDRYKIYLLAYIVSQIVITILIIISLSLKWFSYCVFDFGLNEVYDLDSDYKLGNNNIGDIKEDCDDHNYSDLNDDYCTGFCDNVDNIKKASNFMIIFASISLLFIGLNIAFYTIRFFYEDFRLKGITLACGFMQVFMYVLGIILYGAKANFQDFDDEDCPSSDDCENFEVKAGFVMAFVNAVLLALVNIYALLFTRKAFIDGEHHHS